MLHFFTTAAILAWIAIVSCRSGRINLNESPDPPKVRRGNFKEVIVSEARENDRYRSSEVQSRLKRNAVRDPRGLWPDERVPYYITSKFRSLDAIKAAFEEFANKTCIKFVPKTHGDANFIQIEQAKDCSSYIGRKGGAQNINLTEGCASRIGDVLHELMHAIGFEHEQSRYDRDDYITIYKDNIKTGEEHNFKKVSSKYFTNLGTHYDWKSIMHYSSDGLSSNGQNTIVRKDNGPPIIDPQQFSQRDILKINRLYNCIDKGKFAIRMPAEPMRRNGQLYYWGPEYHVNRSGYKMCSLPYNVSSVENLFGNVLFDSGSSPKHIFWSCRSETEECCGYECCMSFTVTILTVVIILLLFSLFIAMVVAGCREGRDKVIINQ